MKKFLDEFKAFVCRGNVLDLAVGVIIGGAFQSLVKSLIDNLISPILGVVAGKDLSAWSLNIFNVHIKYGAFITALMNFVLMALIVFLIVKAVNFIMSLGKKKEKEVPVVTKKCPFCCCEIAIEATRCPNCTSVLEEK